MSTVDIVGLREKFMAEGLDESELHHDPMVQLQAWLDVAFEAGIHNANSMAVTSVSEDGWPSVRNVLMRGIIDGGPVFYTNYESRKGVELGARPHTEALFSWLDLERQVRIAGEVSRVSPEQSDAYFASRPRLSRLAALASDQSRPIPSREWLERRFNALVAAHEGIDVPRPDHWGGFRIEPRRVEFWQGRDHRLHDRLVYEPTAQGWEIIRLAP